MDSAVLGTVNGVAVSAVEDLRSVYYDGVVVVSMAPTLGTALPHLLEDQIAAAIELDQFFQHEATLQHCPSVAGQRLVISPTGPFTPYDDIRSIYEAAKKGIIRALKAGIKRPILILQSVAQFPDSELVMLLGAFEALYVPLQLRELVPEKKSKITRLGLFAEGLKKSLVQVATNAIALEAGRILARDIGGGDPERMAPPAVAKYVLEAFTGDTVKVTIKDNIKEFEKEYPLFAAVNRAASEIPRHRGRLIYLEYTPIGVVTDTVMLVGKGITYDTGGVNLKVSGTMVGMSRDKCGAAAVAGFFKTVALLKPLQLRVVGVMCVARNSVGENSYVSDELIVSRSGKQVRIGDTDAEGRMVMADLLHEMRERAEKETRPHIYTIATLTGHAIHSVGPGYTIVMDNHVARQENHALKLRSSGEELADMIEVSTIRREDLAFHRGQAEGDDILQDYWEPSEMTSRGHQGPAAFLLLVSGLNEANVKYSHLDIAGSGGSLPNEPTAAPILALANHYKLIKY